jgi:hypothetical protein
LEFLACFTEREVDLAEEVLQLLLYWLQQPIDGAPPPGLLDTIRDFFPSRFGVPPVLSILLS